MYIWLYMYEYSSATRHQSQPLSRSAFHVMIFQVALCCRRWTVTLRNVPSSAVPWQIGFQRVNVPTTSPPTAPSFWTGEAIVDGKARPVFKDPVTDQGDCDRIWLVEWCCDGVLVCFKLNVFVGVFSFWVTKKGIQNALWGKKSKQGRLKLVKRHLAQGQGRCFFEGSFSWMKQCEAKGLMIEDSFGSVSWISWISWNQSLGFSGFPKPLAPRHTTAESTHHLSSEARAWSPHWPMAKEIQRRTCWWTSLRMVVRPNLHSAMSGPDLGELVNWFLMVFVWFCIG